ncbi:MAG: hypothetical protein LBC20_18130 [Planctomycetaceae bacterium]|jgi:hypothetical protein|nr:hypothetical protein [Planctomycetaceae bacterium]
MIIKTILTGISGNFALDKKEVTLEWLVFSNELNDFAVAISQQGTVENMIVGGEAKGWLAPGKPYQLGNETWNTAFAGELNVSERKIIRGTGNYNIQIAGGTVGIVPITPTGIVQWKVTQKYSTKENKESEEGDNTNNPFTLKMSVELEDMPFERDIRTEKLILNSAKQFFNPPPTMKRKITTYSITRREYGNPVGKAKIYSNVVNSDNFHGAAPGTVLMESVTCSFDGKVWSDVTYTFKERLDGWQTYLLDTGTMELQDGKLVSIINDDGTPVSEPVKLNGAGEKLDNQNEDGYNVGPFWKYPALSFTALQLPNFYTVISAPQ